ncbi:MAG: SusC/RagA family TonB-linked outer membrane protein [Bacteroidetes bacterium]|nr:MAG: SusC/RagA family TonB-linked outer membrane protein [Bacteroidota bacterium]TAF93914.1 MAG: SusC/RagA family TonB-linked outer membrane protein [Bacteroidota bacterium]
MRKLLTLLCVCLLSLQLFAQTKRVSGKITDKNGKPLSGVSILVKGTTVGTLTNDDGSYVLNVPANGKTLVVSSVNFETQEITLGTKNTISVTLASSDQSLDDVVVTGYSRKKRTEFTGSSSKVEAKAIEQVPMASFEQILQGRVPGLYIASGSGQPGSSARVNIRGVGSISGGNDPLYVLDGIPIEAGVFRSLNPNDFENVEVLKDAAGAGQYGSRGANGVIVITSKKGKGGKPVVTFRSQRGVSNAPRQANITLLNSEQRLEYEARVLGGPVGLLANTTTNGFPGWDWSPSNPAVQAATPAQQANFARLLDSTKSIDQRWPDQFFRNATFVQDELSVSGGDQKLSFFTSLSRFKQQGSIFRSNLDRYTFRGNIDFKSDRLTVSVRSFAGFSGLSNIESENAVALANPIAAAFLELPYRRLRRPDGSLATGAGLTGANAYERLFVTTSLSNQFKGNLGLTVQYNIWDGLSFKTTNGVDWRNNNASRFIDPNSFAGSLVVPGNQGLYNESNAENLQLVSTTGLVYNKTFANKHTVNAMAMIEAIRNRFRNFGATGYGLNPRLPNTPAAITAGTAANGLIPAIGGGRTWNGLFSEFFMADYTYDRRFSVSASVRRDAPSQVPAKNRNNVFYTAGATWNITNEKFFKKQSFLDEARIRASRGEAANANGLLSDFGYISTYGAFSGYAGVAGIVPTSPGNEDFRLESQVISNIGLDLSFWKKRARVTVDYYVKDTRNLFVNQPLSRTSGFTALSTNAAQMRNSGVDFNFNVDVVSTSDLLVTVGLNGNFNKNRIRSLGLLSEIPQGTGIIRVGLPLGSHFTVGWLGVDPVSGQPVYQDINGNPTNFYSAANNRAAFGTFLPSFTGGSSLDITYKGFTFSALLSTAQGIKRFNNESFFYETTNSNVAFNKRVELLETWQRPGDRTNYQRISSQRQFSSRDIMDASFIRLRNVTVAYNYTTPKGKPIKAVRFYMQAQNLYTWTKWQGFDPEESNNIAQYEFPNPRTYSAGLDITF